MHRPAFTLGLAFAASALSLSLPPLMTPALAQSATEAASGTVQDALGRPVPGVSLQLRTPLGHTVARVTSGADGGFRFPVVAPGPYAIIATRQGYDETTAIVLVSASGTPTTTLTMTARKALSVAISAKRLEEGRTGIEAQTGSSVYHIDHTAIKQLPQGQQTTVQQVLLQAPGVVQNVYGQVHVRGDHGNLQYRINGIVLPEGVTGFGETLDTRFADGVNLLDGALPAEYGDRTAGVVDITTKSGYVAPGGRIDLYEGLNGGSQILSEPSFQYGGSAGGSSFYLDGAYTKNPFEVGSPDTQFPIHDTSNTGRGFGYFSQMLDPTTKASVILGTSVQTLQVPTLAGATSSFAVNQNGTTFDQSNYPSQNVNDLLSPTNHYGIVALQGAPSSALNYQVALFGRYSDLKYTADNIGDLLYRSGVASTVDHNDLAGGLQADSSLKAGADHTVRFGLAASDENANVNNSSLVFPVGASGNPTTTTPETIHDNSSLNSQLYGLYAQDEWKLLPPLTLNYGLRYDAMAGFLRTDQLSPRVGLVYDATPATTLHAGYARYFSPPSTELITTKSLSLFQGTTNAISMNPNQVNTTSLPERDNYYDVGVSQKLLPGWTAGLDGYYKDGQDVQDEGQFNGSPVYSTFNYSRGWVTGLELSTAYHTQALSTYLNLAAAQALAQGVATNQYNFSAADLAYIASHPIHMDHDQGLTASAGVSYDLLGTQVGLDALFGSGLRTDATAADGTNIPNGASLPPYFQLNGSVSRSFSLPGFGKFDARFAVINLLDSVYQLRDTAAIGVSANVYGPRRTFYLGLGKEF